MKAVRESGLRLRVLGAALATVLSHGAMADLVGEVETRMAVAGKSDTALTEANPLFDELARRSPQALEEILAFLRAPLPEIGQRRTLADDSSPAAELEDDVLEENPDVAQLYRESPEAALDLLRLIREAARQP